MTDVLVIGGGPAGLMAAIAAREAGARVLLVEKGDRLGRKLAISGGGRCNVTNAKPLPELMQHVLGNPKFLYSSFHRFGNEDIIRFFEGLGVKLKEEDRGRMFPVSDDARTVVRAVVRHMERLGVEVRLQTPVARILTQERRFVGVETERGEVLAASACVIASGGASVPQTGSTGDGYRFAASVGHTIVPPYPTAVPITSDHPWIRHRELQGLSLYGIELSIFRGDKRLTVEPGDLVFTHFGLSGPAALRASHYVTVSLRDKPGAKLTASIDVRPDRTFEDWMALFKSARERHPKRRLRTELEGHVPDRLAAFILHEAQVDGEIPLAQTSHESLTKMSRALKRLVIPVTGTLPLEKATVTGGGVSVKEIDPKTMQSKLCAGLYFAGEVMDVHAHTGGYNITIAFSTGHTAGSEAARHALAHARLEPV
ncbi:NAD(P)/FAD-dependent oxidoreductase [Alicyclobacillus mali]|uniref:NAD(P)/FAD-dependent oxidoreductase n=1 Tax=Alicyclobacillus mali (ex Roth et al. 2021) TaxID=1123961 RepID=A0ABS0F370_9BACL|nr:NAD(P)/FAD-dependent oxidoreductase [Alicyclobacillus mali (ex Roth et al. 2021)]MBF8377750.1 NAD(P)/FAD-dependent oxidoreductase [Alicyclobacillus mali (ex Roth et al. 2021)]MCL6488343.1 NAD(P)/FAD-dependent oxidoreductase [Alicyclobacillus mali (ex Roth et al. 2021)]